MSGMFSIESEMVLGANQHDGWPMVATTKVPLGNQWGSEGRFHSGLEKLEALPVEILAALPRCEPHGQGA